MYLCEDCHHNLRQIPKFKYTINAFSAELQRVKCAATTLHLETIAGEVVERLRRSKNIMIYNLPEKKSPILIDNDLHDITSVMKIINHILIVHETEIKIRRLGWDTRSIGARPRPVLVCFESTEKARQILKNKLALKAKFCVTIGSDETPMQQMILHHLREELKERIKTDSNLTIKYVRGSPRIVKMDLLDMGA